MSFLPQLFIALLIWLIVIGTLISPELKTYSAQLIALLLLFYIILKHLQDLFRKKEVVKAKEDEQTLLFLSTYLKPKISSLVDLTDHEENQTILQKQLQLLEREVEKYLEEKEQEISV